MSKLQKIKLRTSLLRIWFVKNISVFLQLSVLVAVIFALTGNLNENVPILGSISGSINDTLAANNTGNFWLDLITGAGTLVFSAGLLSTKLKSIALADIKSKNMKKALVQAGMYFNADGKLVKRLEKITSIDIDGDNKVGDVDIHDLPQENLLVGTKRATEELITIMTTKFDTPEQAEEIKHSAKLLETEQILEEETGEVKNVIKDELIENIQSEFEDPVARGEFLAKSKVVLASIGKNVAKAAKFVGNKTAVGTKIAAAKTWSGISWTGNKIWSGFKFISSSLKGLFATKTKTNAKILAVNGLLGLDQKQVEAKVRSSFGADAEIVKVVVPQTQIKKVEKIEPKTQLVSQNEVKVEPKPEVISEKIIQEEKEVLEPIETVVKNKVDNRTALEKFKAGEQLDYSKLTRDEKKQIEREKVRLANSK